MIQKRYSLGRGDYPILGECCLQRSMAEDANGEYVLYEDYRKRMSEALSCMQYMLNNERLAYESHVGTLSRYRDSLQEHWQEMHEPRHNRMQDIINHLREGI